MKKYKKAALNIAFFTILLSSGLNSAYSFFSTADIDFDYNLNNKKVAKLLPANQEKIAKTFENNDYQAWQKVVGVNNKIVSLVNRDSFERFVRAREAARNGDYKQAIEITESLKSEILSA